MTAKSRIELHMEVPTEVEVDQFHKNEQWRLVRVVEEPEHIKLTWCRGSKVYRESLNQNAQKKILPPSHSRFLTVTALALVRFWGEKEQITKETPVTTVRRLINKRFPDLSLGDEDWKPEEQSAA